MPLDWTEGDRLTALGRYRILDTPPEREFDDIARVAASVCDVPMASISLVDGHRQWFKAAFGLEVTETPREVAFCAHAIEGDGTLIVENAMLDERFADNPLVTRDPGLRFYAGAPLVTSDGFPLGTLCVLDTRPRKLTDHQREMLEILARQVLGQLELRRALAQQRIDEKRNRLIIESALDYAVITLDLNGNVTSWNVGATRLFGWPADSVVDRPFDDVFTAEDRAASRLQHAMASALAAGRVEHERWAVRRDGTRFWASGEMMRLNGDDGEPVGFLKILRDRSERKDAELRLKHSDARTRMALEATDLGTWEAVPSLGLVDGDARARELLDHEDDGPIDYQSQFLKRIHPSHREIVDRHLRDALSATGTGLIDAEYRMSDSREGVPRWVHSRARVVKDTGERLRLVGTMRDVTAEKAAEAQRKLLSEELQHRVKNTLAVVQSIVSQSLRTVSTPDEARDAITSRLQTLAQAHDVLTRTSWAAAPILEIIDGAVLAHGSLDGRIRTAGPLLHLKPRSALALSMVFHELCTNAIKYGALSEPGGHVVIDWSVTGGRDDQILHLSWSEHGGPPVVSPSRRGFGSRLIQTSVTGDLGTTVLDFASAGVRWTLTARLAAIQED